MPSGTSLYELASAYWSSCTLQAALDLGLFLALAESPGTAEGLADTCGCDAETLTALLDACVGLGLLFKEQETYGIRGEHLPFLDPASPDSLLAAFAFNRDLQGLWNRLPQCVQTGKPVLPASPHLGADPERTRRFVEGMHSRAALMARGLLLVVNPEPRSRILDLAGGPGTFSLRLAERDPTLAITVFDLPPVVQAAQEIHRHHPRSSCLSFEGGDYHTDELTETYDLILYCGALHQELPDQVSVLLRKCAEALAPGGRLMIVDLLLDADRTTPVYSALFDLNMRLMKPTSHVHTVREVTKELDKQEFRVLRSGDVPETPYRFIEAERG